MVELDDGSDKERDERMPKSKKTQAKCIIEGLQIILKYDPSGSVWMDWRELHAGDTFDEDHATAEDKKKLQELGWHPCSRGGWELFI